MLLPQGKYYTLADVLCWDDRERWELIDGVPLMMACQDTPEDQRRAVRSTARVSEREKVRGLSRALRCSPV